MILPVFRPALQIFKKEKNGGGQKKTSKKNRAFLPIFPAYTPLMIIPLLAGIPLPTVQVIPPSRAQNVSGTRSLAGY